jgi:hypothetical protein
MSRLGQVSLTKPTYRRIVLRCCSVPQRSPRQITSIGSHRGRTLWAIPPRSQGILQAGRSRPRYASGATGIGKLENGSRPKAISEVERLRRSLPEPDPENRAAISIRSARPPIIAVIGASLEDAGLNCHPSGARLRGGEVVRKGGISFGGIRGQRLSCRRGLQSDATSDRTFQERRLTQSDSYRTRALCPPRSAEPSQSNT